jgi:hypothetical protein
LRGCANYFEVATVSKAYRAIDDLAGNGDTKAIPIPTRWLIITTSSCARGVGLDPDTSVGHTARQVFDLPCPCAVCGTTTRDLLKLAAAPIARMSRTCTERLRGFMETVRDLVAGAPVKHMDETGFRRAGKTQ